MRHDFIDRYSRLDSPVHRLPAGLKLAVALALVICIVIMPLSVWPFFAAVAAFLLGVVLLCRVPKRFILRRLVFLEPFVLGVALLTIFQKNGAWVFLSILVRSTLCLLTMILLSNTTPFAKILQVLRRIHTPPLLVTTLALMYRYLFVLIDEQERMRRARQSRTFVPGRWRTWRMMGTLIGQLFVRSTQRAERIYAAMCARGWR